MLGYRSMQSPVSGFQMILMFVHLNYNLLLDIADPYPLFLETDTWAGQENTSC